MLPMNSNDHTRNLQRTTDGARCPEHVKVNVRSLRSPRSTHSPAVEETKYTYGIIRRHINDELSH